MAKKPNYQFEKRQKDLAKKKKKEAKLQKKMEKRLGAGTDADQPADADEAGEADPVRSSDGGDSG